MNNSNHQDQCRGLVGTVNIMHLLVSYTSLSLVAWACTWTLVLVINLYRAADMYDEFVTGDDWLFLSSVYLSRNNLTKALEREGEKYSEGPRFDSYGFSLHSLSQSDVVKIKTLVVPCVHMFIRKQKHQWQLQTEFLKKVSTTLHEHNTQYLYCIYTEHVQLKYSIEVKKFKQLRHCEHNTPTCKNLEVTKEGEKLSTTYTRILEWSPASVGLAQAHPN